MSKYRNTTPNKYFKMLIIIAAAVIIVFTLKLPVHAAMSLTAVPEAPDTDTQVRLQWSVVPNARYYDVYRDAAKICTIDVNAVLNPFMYIDAGLEPETLYNYEVCALDSAQAELDNNSTNITTAQMLSPSDITWRYDINSRAVTLTWTNNSAATTGSTIVRTSDATQMGVLNDAGTTCTFTDPGIAINTESHYVVASNDGNGHSSASSTPIDVLPVAPPAVAASMTNGVATISWGTYDYIAGFQLERSKWSGVAWSVWEVIDAQLSGQQVVDTQLVAGSYRYRLTTKNTGVYSGYSNLTATMSKPASPANVACRLAASNRIDISWTNNADNNSSLLVERKAGTGSFAQVAILGAGAASYQDTFNFSTDTTYYYRIIAYDSANNTSISPECAVRTVLPTAPTQLKLTIQSSTQIRLNWTNNAANNESLVYKIEKKTDAGSFIEITTASPITSGTTVYADTGLESGRIYAYRVRASNPIGNSACTNEVSTTTTSITAPSSLAVTAISSSQIDLSWAYPDPGSYSAILERKTGISGTWSAITASPLAAGIIKYSDVGLSANTQYFYRVKTANSSYVYSKTYPDNDEGTGTYTMLGTLVLYGNATSSSQIFISWSGNSAGTESVVERRIADGTYIRIYTAAAGVTSWYDSNLIPNARYTYRIKAKSTTNESIYSNEVTVTNYYLEGPTNLTAATPSDSEIELAWTDNSITETGFEIWRFTSGSGNYALYNTAGQNSISFVDTNISPGLQYYYMVRAYNLPGNAYSAFSNTASGGVGILNPPGDLQFGAISDTQVSLTWTDNTIGESGFKVERRIGANGEWTVIATLAANTTSYTSTWLSPYTQYFYRIRAYSYSYSSDSCSNEIEVSTGVPQAPKNLTLSAVSSSQVNLKWTDASSNEQGFRIERKKSSDQSFRQVAQVGPGTTLYSDRGLKGGIRYLYRVSAYNKSGTSVSGTVSVTAKETVTFSDVNNIAWATDAIENLASRGVIKGKSANRFAPNDTMSRAEFACLIVRAFGLDMTPVGSYEDVKAGKWYYREIMIAKSLGIVTGDEKNCFYPERSISREDMAVITVKALRIINNPLTGYSNDVLEEFRDKNMISPYALSSMASLVGDDIMEGKPGSVIAPKDSTTRAEAAVMIYKVIDR